MKKTYGMLAVAAVALMATPALAQIKIGTAGPMTGSNAAFGEQLKRGAEMAVQDINAAGGVNGQKLELTIGDDACDPKQATAVANKMVSDKVAFVAGNDKTALAGFRVEQAGTQLAEQAQTLFGVGDKVIGRDQVAERGV